MRTRILLGLLLCAAASSLLASTIIVDANQNIFRAGQSTWDPADAMHFYGAAPTLYPYAVSSAQPYLVLHFNATGAVSCTSDDSCRSFNSLEGGGMGDTFVTNVDTSTGISGLTMNGRIMFLVGVFLPLNGPNIVTPSYNIYNAANRPNSQTSFAPLLGQTFFIGDGLANNLIGSPEQDFMIPAVGARLYLGFADYFRRADGTYIPGAYSDNSGSLTLTPGWANATPEPTTVVLVSTALAGLLLSRRKRTA